MPAISKDVAPGETTQDAAAASHEGQFSVGVGYNADDGLIASTELAHPDVLGSGQGLTLAADLSKIQQHASLRHDLPLGGGLALRSELFMSERDVGAYGRGGAGGALELSRALGPATHVFVRYRLERAEMKELPDTRDLVARQGMPPAAGASTISTVGAGLRYDTRDRRDLSGSHLELVAEASQAFADARTSFVRLQASAGTARTFGRFTLRLNGRAEYVRGEHGVPLSERLFDRGNADVRGYALGSMSARMGDNYEAIGHAELAFAVSRKADLSIALFADAGVRGNLDAMMGPTGASTVRSVGVSLIWRGLRLDFAMPLDGGRERQLLFGAGVAF